MAATQITKITTLVVVFFLGPGSAFGGAATNDELYGKTKKILSGQRDFIQRKVQRLGNKTISLETFLSSDGEIKSAQKIMAEREHYAVWMMPGINDRPAGGSYFLRILNMNFARDLLTVGFYFNLPVFHQEGKRVFSLKTETLPNGIAVYAQSTSQPDSFIENATGEMRIYGAEGDANQIWIYIRGNLVLTYQLVYEALPERLMTRESGERIQLIVRNYLKQEDRNRSVRTPAASPSK